MSFAISTWAEIAYHDPSLAQYQFKIAEDVIYDVGNDTFAGKLVATLNQIACNHWSKPWQHTGCTIQCPLLLLACCQMQGTAAPQQSLVMTHSVPEQCFAHEDDNAKGWEEGREGGTKCPVLRQQRTQACAVIQYSLCLCSGDAIRCQEWQGPGARGVLSGPHDRPQWQRHGLRRRNLQH